MKLSYTQTKLFGLQPQVGQLSYRARKKTRLPPGYRPGVLFRSIGCEQRTQYGEKRAPRGWVEAEGRRGLRFESLRERFQKLAPDAQAASEVTERIVNFRHFARSRATAVSGPHLPLGARLVLFINQVQCRSTTDAPS